MQRVSRNRTAIAHGYGYPAAAVKGMGFGYTGAALRGMGDFGYTGAALRGMGDFGYTGAAARGLGYCGGSLFSSLAKKLPLVNTLRQKVQNWQPWQKITKVVKKVNSNKDQIKDVMNTVQNAASKAKTYYDNPFLKSIMTSDSRLQRIYDLAGTPLTKINDTMPRVKTIVDTVLDYDYGDLLRNPEMVSGFLERAGLPGVDQIKEKIVKAVPELENFDFTKKEKEQIYNSILNNAVLGMNKLVTLLDNKKDIRNAKAESDTLTDIATTITHDNKRIPDESSMPSVKPAKTLPAAEPIPTAPPPPPPPAPAAPSSSSKKIGFSPEMLQELLGGLNHVETSSRKHGDKEITQDMVLDALSKLKHYDETAMTDDDTGKTKEPPTLLDQIKAHDWTLRHIASDVPDPVTMVSAAAGRISRRKAGKRRTSGRKKKLTPKEKALLAQMIMASMRQ